MKISKTEVERVAQLAKLEFTDDEKNLLAHQLSEIIEYFKKLSELDTENIEPTFNVIDIKNRLRDDISSSWLTQSEALSNAPKKNNGFFSVPKVISNE